MLRVALKGAWARKLRLVLTSIAVVLGVAFVSGAYLLTDSLRSSFDDLFDQAVSGVAVEVRSQAYRDLTSAQSSGTSAPSASVIDLSKVGVEADVVDKVAAVPGVRDVAGSIFEMGAAQPIERDGTPIGSQGSPTFLANWVEGAEDANIIKLTDGRAPKAGEMLLDASSVKTGEFKLGDDVTVLLKGGREREEFTLVGIIQFGSSSSSFFGAISVFDTTTAQRIVGAGDRFSAVDATSDGSVTDAVLKQRVQRVLSDDYNVVTGAELSQELNEDIDTGFLSLMQNFILAFAAIAVFVGAFTIFNTFTILVGQRTREFGLLRALGASRRQILSLVTFESLLVGAVASTLGIVAGYGIASILRSVINSSGVELPGGAFPLETRTIVVCYAVGILVTLVACLLPAWRASRLSPLDALRTNPAATRVGWKIPLAGLLLFVGGIALVLSGFSMDDASTTSILAAIGAGCALVVLGVALLSRIFIGGVTRVLSPVLALGTTGRLASRNVMRNRARSATTASALMIGIAIATLALVFQASLTKSVDQEIDATIGADITIYNTLAQSGQIALVSEDALARIEAVDGVRDVATQQQGAFQVGRTFTPGEPTEILAGIEPTALEDDGQLTLKTVKGASTPGDGILVDTDAKLKVGDTLTFSTSTNETFSLQVEGTYEPSQIAGPYVVTNETFNRVQPAPLHGASFVMVSATDPDDAAKVADRIEKALGAEGKTLEVQDSEELREQVRSQLGFVIAIVLAMLGLSLVIALFGIANTLALNVFERTREIGLIRAIGGTRPQLRRIIRVEAVLVALFGTIIGVIVGLGAGAALIQGLAEDGLEFAVNVPAVVFVLVGGFIAGLLASLLPARRAARMDVLEAIATD